ncbi:hypothetical protein [Streptomyces sp. NPDC003697]
MRVPQPLLRSVPVVAAVALTAGPAAGPAVAWPDISVSAQGSTVSVTTSACTLVDGSWGTASLLGSGQVAFAQGRQVPLTRTTAGQAATWRSVAPGMYTVIVLCSDDITAGTQSVVVPASPPTVSATSSPSLGVMGDVGGGAKQSGTMTFAVGGTLVAAAMIATGWVLRRRSRPYRL